MRRGGNLFLSPSHLSKTPGSETTILSYHRRRFPEFWRIGLIGRRSFSALGLRAAKLRILRRNDKDWCYMIFRYCLISLLAASLFATAPSANHSKNAESVQAQPAPERIAEIQAALKAHGYEPGATWEETQEVCRKIADEHMWQTDHAPDVRVLILLGLGGPHSDPAVAQMQGDRLDNDQRTEAAHKSESAQAYAETPVPLSVPAAKHSRVPVASSTTLAASSTAIASVKASVKATGKRHVRKTTLVRSKSAAKKKLSTRNRTFSRDRSKARVS